MIPVIVIKDAINLLFSINTPSFMHPETPLKQDHVYKGKRFHVTYNIPYSQRDLFFYELAIYQAQMKNAKFYQPVSISINQILEDAGMATHFANRTKVLEKLLKLNQLLITVANNDARVSFDFRKTVTVVNEDTLNIDFTPIRGYITGADVHKNYLFNIDSSMTIRMLKFIRTSALDKYCSEYLTFKKNAVLDFFNLKETYYYDPQSRTMIDEFIAHTLRQLHDYLSKQAFHFPKYRLIGDEYQPQIQLKNTETKKDDIQVQI